MWAQGIACAIGIWLMASPEVLGYGGTARVHALVVGPIAASLACVAMWQVTRPIRWVNVVIGAWLVLSSAILSDSALSIVNSILSGLALGGLSCFRGRVRHRMAGGGR